MSMIRSRSLLRCLLLVSGGWVLGAPVDAVAQDAGIDELLDFHRELTVAMRVHNDPTMLMSVALDGYLVIPPGGIVETLEEAISGVRNFDSETADVEVEVVTRHADTAVLVGTVAADGQVRGPVPQFGKIRFMAVYVRTADGWRLLAQSKTPCHERAIEAGRC